MGFSSNPSRSGTMSSGTMSGQNSFSGATLLGWSQIVLVMKGNCASWLGATFQWWGNSFLKTRSLGARLSSKKCCPSSLGRKGCLTPLLKRFSYCGSSPLSYFLRYTLFKRFSKMLNLSKFLLALNAAQEVERPLCATTQAFIVPYSCQPYSLFLIIINKYISVKRGK